MSISTIDKTKPTASGIPTPELTCVDLFAGAGGFSLAAIEAGLNLVAAVEIDKAAAATYRLNIPKVQSNKIDFHEIDILDLNPEILEQNPALLENGCDLLLGGPPCQGFSAHRIKDAGVDDKRNTLILRYFEFVKVLKSKFFLMENVPGILWPRHQSYLKKFYEEGSKAGYHLFEPVTLDARDFGVPQRRKRVFVLGVRNDLRCFAPSWPPAPTHGNERDRITTPALRPWVTAGSVFQNALAADDINNVHMNHGVELLDTFRSTPLNGGSRNESKRILPCHKNYNGHSDVYGRIDTRLPGPTMTTACVNPSKGRFLHPFEHHGITLRHAARFQTFPDWYEFSGGLMAGAKQVGNAVPVHFGKFLITHIAKALHFYYDQKNDNNAHFLSDKSSHN